MREPRQVWHCERQYRPVACGAGHINCGVRCVNDGVAAGLYSQPGVVAASRTGCIVDDYGIRGCPICNYTDVSAARSYARAVSGVNGIATWAGDSDTRL